MSGQRTGFSRREMVLGAGAVAMGAMGGGLLMGAVGNPISRAEAKEPQAVPWPYEKIDPKEAGRIAFEGWYKGFCSYAVASGILVSLQQKVGEPYRSLPVEGLRLGEGGIVGWGTICGTLLGVTVAVGFVAPYEVGKQMLNELMQWYSDTELPLYVPAQPRAEVGVKNASNSPLCHVSVSKWCQKAGKSFASAERKERCARLSADVAMRTVMILNDWKENKFKSDLKYPPALYGTTGQHNCYECHGSKVPSPIKS